MRPRNPKGDNMVKPVTSLKTAEKDEKPKPHAIRYPWAELFNNERFVLERGKHFYGMPHGMVSTVRQAAKRHKVRVSIDVTDTNLIVRVTK